MIKNIINTAVNVLNKVIPKKDLVIFNSFPDAGGNAGAVYEYIMKHRPDIVEKYKLVWAVNGSDTTAADALLKNISPDHTVMKKKSVNGLLTYCRAKYIITTHNYITGLYTHGSQKHYNLWHGMPFKTIGKMIENNVTNDVIQADYTIATSELFRGLMARSIGIPEERVLVTGQPSNDSLFHGRDALKRLGIDKKSYSKVLIWMPTYRKSIVGAIHEDGAADGFGAASMLTEHFDKLDRVLREQGLLLLIKPHPMDSINNLNLPQSKNLRVIYNTELSRKGIVLYELLAETDSLLTDYSSVFIDYLITGKPMAFVFDDMESYSSSRGFNFDDPLDYLPGEKLTSADEFLNYLADLDNCDAAWAEKRREITELFCADTDDNSARRVCEAIFGEKK